MKTVTKLFSERIAFLYLRLFEVPIPLHFNASDLKIPEYTMSYRTKRNIKIKV